MAAEQSDKGLSGIIALIVAAAVGGTVFGLGISSGPPVTVDPYEGYCRGYTDGVAKVLMDRFEISLADYAAEAPVVDEACLADIQLAEPVFLAGLRGPLLPYVDGVS